MVTLYFEIQKLQKWKQWPTIRKAAKKISPELLTTNNMKKQPGEMLKPLNSVLERFNHQSFNADKSDVV